jgi:hypothetical protein
VFQEVFPSVFLLETAGSNRLLVGIKSTGPRPTREQLWNAARTIHLYEGFPVNIAAEISARLVDVTVPRLSAQPFTDSDLP